MEPGSQRESHQSPEGGDDDAVEHVDNCDDDEDNHYIHDTFNPRLPSPSSPFIIVITIKEWGSQMTQVGCKKCSKDEVRTSPAATMIPLIVANGFLSGPNLKKTVKRTERKGGFFQTLHNGPRLLWSLKLELSLQLK